MRQARYLAITRAHDVIWPDYRGEIYIPGSARLETRVVSIPDGTLVCAGESFATKLGLIEGRGRGETQADADVAAAKSLSFHVNAYFINAIQYGPLVRICEAGGPIFCEQVRQEAPYVR